MSIEFNMHPGEHTLLVIRKHPLIFVGALIPFALLDYLPHLLPVLGQIILAQAPMVDPAVIGYLSLEHPLTRFFVGGYWLIVWMGAFGVFTNYYLDQWILTNERVISIDQKGFWNREVSSVFLDRVQDVETEISSVFGTLFGFGTVSVEAAGAEVGRFRMPGLSGPRHVRDRILEEVAKRHPAPEPVKAGV